MVLSSEYSQTWTSLHLRSGLLSWGVLGRYNKYNPRLYLKAASSVLREQAGSWDKRLVQCKRDNSKSLKSLCSTSNQIALFKKDHFSCSFSTKVPVAYIPVHVLATKQFQQHSNEEVYHKKAGVYTFLGKTNVWKWESKECLNTYLSSLINNCSRS